MGNQSHTGISAVYIIRKSIRIYYIQILLDCTMITTTTKVYQTGNQ
jgi:hypothetical protein